MENNIKDKKNNNSMVKNMFNVFIIFIFSISILNASNGLLDWEFEEGGGVLALDSTGNNNNGLIDKPQYTTTSKFGNYAQYFDKDYISSLTAVNTPNNMTVSLWIKQIDNGKLSTYFDINNADEEHELYYDETNDELIFNYIDNALVSQSIVINTLTLDDNAWHNIIYSIDNNNDLIKFYIDNIKVFEQTLISGFSHSLNSMGLMVATDGEFVYENYNGIIDSFRIIDIFINDSQVNELYTTNTITLPVITIEPVINGTNQTTSGTIINSLTPIDNSTNYNIVTITSTLNIQSTCNLYFENDLTATFENVLAFNYELDVLDSGNYSYFVYCEYIDENLIKYFEISDVINFEINKNPPNVITFNIIGNDFNVNDMGLYITTPCIEEGFSAMGTKYTPYQPKYNTGGILFTEVNNGLAQMVVNGDINEYCLYNGRIIINEEGKTTNYDPVEIFGVVELGNILTPNNITSTYTIKLDQFDIFNKINPKAWGETWTSIIGGLILLVFGIIIAGGGLVLNNGKVTISGVLLILGALGISFTGFLGLMI